MAEEKEADRHVEMGSLIRDTYSEFLKLYRTLAKLISRFMDIEEKYRKSRNETSVPVRLKEIDVEIMYSEIVVYMYDLSLKGLGCLPDDDSTAVNHLMTMAEDRVKMLELIQRLKEERQELQKKHEKG